MLRGQILMLPIDNTFLYVAPIYMQATQARMPQLKKVALAVGNRLVYADTYDKALADLEAMQQGRRRAASRRPGVADARRTPAGRRATADARIQKSASTWSVTAISPRRANGPKRARNWKRSSPSRRSDAGSATQLLAHEYLVE